MTEPVLVREPRGNVLVLRLNRPEARNALNSELIGELGLALAEAEEDLAVRCVVLTGTGDRAFCAGMDLRDFASGGAPTNTDPKGLETFGRFTRGEVSVPVVGAANATAVAGGFELLLGCDLVVASEAASFGVPEVKRGLFAAGGGVFVSTRIPLAIALELTLTGDLVDAPRAAALGLINRVVPADQLMDIAYDFAERIAANAPLAVFATKQSAVEGLALDLKSAYDNETRHSDRVFETEDAKEGPRAFAEKRPPRWQGR
jgi:enoyl-CoA hydratase/carnithine racemase